MSLRDALYLKPCFRKNLPVWARGWRSREQPGRAFVSLWHPTLRGSVQGVRGCIIKPMASPFAPRGERFQRRAPQTSPAASDPRARVSSAPIEAGCEMSALGTERRLRCSAQARWARTWPAADSSACTPDSPALAQPNQSRLRGAAHTTSRPHGRTTLAHRQSLARASLFATSSPARRRASRAPAPACHSAPTPHAQPCSRRSPALRLLGAAHAPSSLQQVLARSPELYAFSDRPPTPAAAREGAPVLITPTPQP